MKTAVPGTRGGLLLATESRNMSIGNDALFKSLRTIDRPVYHVVISVKIAIARIIGTQPPCVIFNAFEKKKARSIARKNAAKLPALAMLQFHLDRASA